MVRLAQRETRVAEREPPTEYGIIIAAKGREVKSVFQGTDAGALGPMALVAVGFDILSVFPYNRLLHGICPSLSPTGGQGLITEELDDDLQE